MVPCTSVVAAVVEHSAHLAVHPSFVEACHHTWVAVENSALLAAPHTLAAAAAAAANTVVEVVEDFLDTALAAAERSPEAQ